MNRVNHKPHPLTSRVVELARADLPTRDIHTELAGQVHITTIARILRRARQNDPSFPSHQVGRPAGQLSIPKQAMTALESAAAARGITIAEVARRILTNAAVGSLIDAVLDDGVSS